MKNAATIIEQVMGPFIRRGMAYPKPLPPELQQWYCYAVDGGHSILAILPMHLAVWQGAGGDEEEIRQYLCPIPVKSVLRGWWTECGYVVASSPVLRYDPELGLVYPPEDEEF